MKYTLLTPSARALYAAALITLTSAACSDNGPSAPLSPTAPTTASFSAARGRPRVPYISSLVLSSIFVSTTSGYTPFTVTVTNPTRKDVPEIYLKGVLQSGTSQPTPATAFLAYCPNPNGIVHPGDCTMSNGITGTYGPLPLGPGTYTLEVQQRQPDGSMLVLDSKTVDVILYDGTIR
jgi:hypothetical protein